MSAHIDGRFTQATIKELLIVQLRLLYVWSSGAKDALFVLAHPMFEQDQGLTGSP